MIQEAPTIIVQYGVTSEQTILRHLKRKGEEGRKGRRIIYQIVVVSS
jgi:hypothetical protein